MKFPRIERIRGKTLNFYLVVAAFGVASSYYINKPIYDVVNDRRSKKQVEEAVSKIERAKGIENETESSN